MVETVTGAGNELGVTHPPTPQLLHYKLARHIRVAPHRRLSRHDTPQERKTHLRFTLHTIPHNSLLLVRHAVPQRPHRFEQTLLQRRSDAERFTAQEDEQFQESGFFVELESAAGGHDGTHASNVIEALIERAVHHALQLVQALTISLFVLWYGSVVQLQHRIDLREDRKRLFFWNGKNCAVLERLQIQGSEIGLHNHSLLQPSPEPRTPHNTPSPTRSPRIGGRTRRERRPAWAQPARIRGGSRTPRANRRCAVRSTS